MKDKLLFIEIVLGVFALGFSSLWVLNPESNLEPLLVLLGFIITFFEIYRRRNKSQLDEQVIPQVSVVSENNHQVNSEDGRFKNETAEKNDEVEERKNVNFGTVTLEHLLEGLNKEKFTGMQISQFVKRTTDVGITCEVIVHNIKEGFSLDDENAFIMVFSPIAQLSESMPEFITASFNKSSESDLASISSGDSAVVSAEVGFIELGGNYSISLNKAKILSVGKMPTSKSR